MHQKMTKLYPLLLSMILLSIVYSGASHAQDNDQLNANEQCNKVILKVAETRGKNYGTNPCDSNSYPAEFWQCVEKQIDNFDLSMSIFFCEQEFGFN